jgi:hypothetical protein
MHCGDVSIHHKGYVVYILSGPAGSDKEVGMVRVIVEDKVARWSLVIPAQTCLLETPFHQLW